MGVIRSHKIRLYPTREQEAVLIKTCGVARFAYNWGLAEWKRRYEAGEKCSWMDLSKHLNAIKREQFPWMMEVTKWAPAYSIQNVGMAFSKFFKKTAKYPRFKKKGQRDSFEVGNTDFNIKDTHVVLPKMGKVRLAQPLRFKGKLLKVIVSRTADKWFISLTVDLGEITPSRNENQGPVGVDLGLTTFATLSTGEKIQAPKPLKANLKKTARLQRSVSRKKKGSKNREKAKLKVARLHYRVACIRGDFIHKLTSGLVRKHEVVGIEDLNVAGMQQRFGKALSDVSLYEFRRQLQYKAESRGSRVVVADRWFASTKTCSVCSSKNQALTLKDRHWTCPCGAQHDRDINAAINLKQYAVAAVV